MIEVESCQPAVQVYEKSQLKRFALVEFLEGHSRLSEWRYLIGHYIVLLMLCSNKVYLALLPRY